MATITRKKNARHKVSPYVRKLPHTVRKQLESIYIKSGKEIQRHPYMLATGILLSLGFVSGAYILINYFKNK